MRGFSKNGANYFSWDAETRQDAPGGTRRRRNGDGRLLYTVQREVILATRNFLGFGLTPPQSDLDYVREGDILVVAKLDRLARSVTDLMAILQALERKRVGVRILNLGMDTRTPTGKLMLTVLGAVAQFEREMMLERQREGITKAKSAGKYKGRKPIAAERRQDVLKLAAEGATRTVIASQLGIGEATVYRILAADRGQKP